MASAVASPDDKGTGDPSRRGSTVMVPGDPTSPMAA